MSVEFDDVCNHFVRTDNVEIHYCEAGEGTPLICLHGTGPGANAWVNFRNNIGDLSKEHRVLLVDLPRFGRSEKVVLPGPRLDVLSAVIRDFMDAMAIDKANFIGNSMGAQVALKLAIDTPDRVGRMVLVAPAVLAESIFGAMPTEAVRQIAGYYQDEGPSFEKMRSLMRALVYDSSLVTDEAVRERYEASIDPEVVKVNQGGHWTHQPLDSEVHRVQSSVLFVWGQDDRASPLDHGLALLRKLPDARLYVLSRAGHSVQSEKSEEFNRVALDFLRGQ